MGTSFINVHLFMHSLRAPSAFLMVLLISGQVARGKSEKLYEQSDPAAALTLNSIGVLAPTCNNVPLLNHFLVLDSTLLSSMPMTSLSRRLFLAGVERSGSVVLPGLGAEQTLPVCPLQTLWPQAGGHRGCLFKAAFRWTTDQFDGGRRTHSTRFAICG